VGGEDITRSDYLFSCIKMQSFFLNQYVDALSAKNAECPSFMYALLSTQRPASVLPPTQHNFLVDAHIHVAAVKPVGNVLVVGLLGSMLVSSMYSGTVPTCTRQTLA